MQNLREFSDHFWWISGCFPPSSVAVATHRHGPDLLRGQRHGGDLRRHGEGRGSGEGTEGRAGAIHRGAMGSANVENG